MKALFTLGVVCVEAGFILAVGPDRTVVKPAPTKPNLPSEGGNFQGESCVPSHRIQGVG
jgi:hypothetical protein